MHSHQLKSILLVCVVVSGVGIGVGLIAGGAAAQEIPSLPASYAPVEITLAGDAEIDTPVRVEAVVDGEVQSSLITNADGTSPNGEVLEVQEPENTDTVGFRINGTIVETVEWESGEQEVVLDEVDPELVSSVLGVTITERTASPVEAGETVSVTAELENPEQYGVEARQTIELTAGGGTVDSEAVEVPIGETETVTLTWTPTEQDTGDTALRVVSENERDTVIVRVEAAQDTQQDDDEDGDSSGGGGGSSGGGGGAGEPTGTSDEQPPSVVNIRDTLKLLEPTESQTPVVDTDPEAPGVTVSPPAVGSVQQIVFENTSVQGSVTISEYSDPPETVRTRLESSIQADTGINQNVSILSVSNIQPSSEAAEDSAATVRFTVDSAQVEDPSRLRIFKETYIQEAQEQQWRQVETTVNETTDGEIAIEATIDSFSLFTIAESAPVAENGDDTSADDSESDTGTDSENGDDTDGETDDGVPGFGVIAAVVGLLSGIALMRAVNNPSLLRSGR